MTALAYTIPDAVKMLGIGRSTLYELINIGRIKARKAGSRTLILHTELEAYLASLPEYQWWGSND
jgi:excisionase family DNA binding protein